METSRRLRWRLVGDAEQQPEEFSFWGWVGAIIGRAIYLVILAVLEVGDRLTYLALFAAEAAIIARVYLKAVGADPSKPLPEIVYAVSEPLVQPFLSMASTVPAQPMVVGSHVLEPISLMASLVYVFGAWALVVVLNLVKRIL